MHSGKQRQMDRHTNRQKDRSYVDIIFVKNNYNNLCMAHLPMCVDEISIQIHSIVGFSNFVFFLFMFS